MKNVVFCMISLSVLLAVVGVNCFASEANSPETKVDANVLREEGRLFLKEMSAVGMDLDKRSYFIYHDLTSLCHKYRWVGLTLGQAAIKLRAAGQIGGFHPSYNNQLPPESGNRNDLGVAFFLNYGERRGPLFQMSFRPDGPGTGLHRKIKEVVNCSIAKPKGI